MALMIGRKEGEVVLIGEDIRIMVNRLTGKRVQLAIEAPKDLRIVREEIAGKDESDGKD